MRTHLCEPRSLDPAQQYSTLRIARVGRERRDRGTYHHASNYQAFRNN